MYPSAMCSANASRLDPAKGPTDRADRSGQRGVIQRGEVPAPVDVCGVDPMAKLRELADMKSQGLINDEEFTAMKAKLIGL